MRAVRSRKESLCSRHSLPMRDCPRPPPPEVLLVQATTMMHASLLLLLLRPALGSAARCRRRASCGGFSKRSASRRRDVAPWCHIHAHLPWRRTASVVCPVWSKVFSVIRRGRACIPLVCMYCGSARLGTPRPGLEPPVDESCGRARLSVRSRVMPSSSACDAARRRATTGRFEIPDATARRHVASRHATSFRTAVSYTFRCTKDRLFVTGGVMADRTGR